MAKQKLKDKGYKMSLEILGEKTELIGVSIPEILDQIQKNLIRGCAKVSIKNGSLSAQTILYPGQLRRLMVSNTAKLLLAKKLESMLK